MWPASDSSASDEAEHPGDDLDRHEREDQRQRHHQRAPVGVAVYVCVVVCDGRIVARWPDRRCAAISSSTDRPACAPRARSFRPCGSGPRTTGRAASLENASSSLAGSRIQSPRSSSPSSWPGPQPAWPRNARPDRTPAVSSSDEGPVPSTPTSSNASRAASVGVFELGQDDHRRRLDRAADEQLLLGIEQRLELGDGLADAGLRRAVQDQPERALVVVLDDEHDRAPEVRVQQRRTGDQQLSSHRLHQASRLPGFNVGPLRGQQA